MQSLARCLGTWQVNCSLVLKGAGSSAFFVSLFLSLVCDFGKGMKHAMDAELEEREGAYAQQKT